MDIRIGSYIVTALAIAAGVSLVIMNKDGKPVRSLKLKIKGVQLQDQQIIMTMQVVNPNDQAIAIQGLTGDMFANDKKVASVNMAGDYIVKAKDDISIALITKPVVANLLSSLFTMFNQRKAKVFFTGAIKVDNHAVPLQMAYTT